VKQQVSHSGALKSRRFVLTVLTALGLCALLAGTATAAETSPVGYWRTVPDDDAAPATIQIWLEGEKLFGKIVALFPRPGFDPNPKCERCEGALKNRPIKGLTIIEGLAQSGDEWTGGKILDPANGKSYRCKIQVVPGGVKLKVRGYIGFSLLGRTQVWERTVPPAAAP
jgi:uncharacterized protein (DUF2147 family)